MSATEATALTRGAEGVGGVGAALSAAGSMLPAGGGKGGQIAAQSLFTASAAVNAIPVAGQFASAGLAIAGVLTKLFAGKKQAKKREQAADAQRKLQATSAKIKSGAQSDARSGVGLGSSSGPIGATAPITPAVTPSFASFGGGQSPTLQPTQQAIQHSIGIK